ncbi:MAG TPA: hypothetical protein VKT72_01980 [Candidatus Baltobacteraceae bacterium]|nr:hypothetical protein [Candidatus Baltobacteraceae bacterium]
MEHAPLAAVTLHYRVVVFRTEDAQYKAYVRAFPSLGVRGATPEKTIDAARREIVRILGEYAREGRRPPAPDREMKPSTNSRFACI